MMPPFEIPGTITAQAVKDILRACGVDLVGIARADSVLLSHPPRPPRDLMPTSKSVVVMALAHQLGAVYAPDIMLWTRSKIQTSRLLDEAADLLSRILERKGFLSLAISADKPVEILKRDPRTGRKYRVPKVVGFLSLRHAAVSCGMGEIGRNNLLLTPEFGPHQRLCAVVTEAPLEPDPPRRHSLCSDCGRCIEACPAGALSPSGHDVDRCFMYWTYGFKALPPAAPSQWPSFIRMLLRHMKWRDFLVETGQTLMTDVDNCIECMRACPVGDRWERIRPDRLPPQRTRGMPGP
ncbi:MAG TPA: 4Fe-4S binding protein [Deltaproteobacteria bacterium]|nr:4Fe-4S binding protein [Deltaproteobacteria bacterium]HPP79592.1 4Fe-4S binding protein [Deltaproteobacteria bacterium]